MPKLDQIDLHILEELQRDSSRTNVELARVVGLSPPACLRRVRKLRASGAIRGEVALVDPAVFGPQLTVVAGVILERERREMVAAFERRVGADPAVVQCWCVAGGYDFVIVFRVRDVAAYEAAAQRIFHSDANVKRYESFVVLGEVKRPAAEGAPRIPAKPSRVG